MSWVEEIGPDDDVEVETILPDFYVNYNRRTMPSYASGISHLCKGAAILGDDDTEFLIYGMTIYQIMAV